MRNNKIDKNTHSALIRAYSRAGKIKDSLVLLKELVNSNQGVEEVVFNTLLDGCAKNELLQEISTVTHLMLQSGLSLGTVSYNSIIDGYVRCQEFWKAWEC